MKKMIVGLLGLVFAFAANAVMMVASDNALVRGDNSQQDESESLAAKISGNSTYVRYSYLRFDTSSISHKAYITSASLDLYVSSMGTRADGGAPTYTLYALNDVVAYPNAMAGEETWTADMIWSTRPDGTATYPGNVYGTEVARVSGAQDGSVVSFEIESGKLNIFSADSNNEITFLIVSSADTLMTSFASLSNTSGYAVPTLTVTELDVTAFSIGSDGINDTLPGSGAVTEDGVFVLDLTGASTTRGDSWQLVDVDSLSVNYGNNFRMVSTKGYFTEVKGVWSITENGIGYAFSEETGRLTVVPAGYWLSGAMGIGWWFIPTNKSYIKGWNVETLIAQVKTVPDITHVVFNLSNTYNSYTAPHSVLDVVNPGATNERDLFMEMALAFQEEGIRVIAYIACQGPAMLKHGVQLSYDAELVDEVWTSDAMDNWEDYVYSVYGNTTDATYKRAFAEVVVNEYAERYGALIDGWWFDNGSDSMNAPLLHEVVTSHNPNTICTFNGSSENVDYRTGHPTPLGTAAASDDVNLPMLHGIEENNGLYSGGTVVGHMFMAAQERWTSGDLVWEVDKAADWVDRCISAGGVWTWSVDTSPSASNLRADTVVLMQDVYAKIAENESNRAPAFTLDTIFGGDADFGVAYSGSLAGTATDPDGDSLRYDNVSGPNWLNVSVDGTLSGIPDDEYPFGINSFKVVVSDGKGNSDITDLEIVVHNAATGDRVYSYLEFADLRADLVTGTIAGLSASDANVSISMGTDGDDVIYSFSIMNQDFEDDGAADDSLSWDLRFEAFNNSTYVLNGNDSSVSLGASATANASSYSFRVNSHESIQFSAENVVLNGATGATAEFAGFTQIYGSSGGTCILGTGSGGLTSGSFSGYISLPSPTVLTLTSIDDSKRFWNMDGRLRIYKANNDPYFIASLIEAHANDDVAYSDTLTNLDALATDADGDTLTYSKASGPDWLTVAAAGALSGTPSAGDTGVNVFTIEVSDGNGGTDQVVLQVTVGSLIAHWTLDDRSGTTAVDDTGNGYDGTITDETWTTGLDVGALDFNGGSSKMTIPSTVFSTINNEISIAMWVNGAATQPRQDSIFYAVNSAEERVLNIHVPWSNLTVYWDAGNIGDDYDRIYKVANMENFMGQWNHWVFTKNAMTGEMTIYLNGSLWHTGSGNTKTITGITAATLGGQIASFGYDGQIDDVKIYNVALSAQEITTLFEGYRMNGISVDWLSEYNLPITDSVYSDNPDGDELSNFAEYALGGDPTNPADSGFVQRLSSTSHELDFVYARRIGVEDELDYYLETCSNLLSNDWTEGSYEEHLDTGTLSDEFEAVSNRLDITGTTNQFIRLKIHAKE